MAKTVKKEEGQEGVSKFDKKIAELEGRFGKGSIISGKNVAADGDVVSTGSLNFDVATNCMGKPLGILVEYQGMESSGKSTASLHDIAEHQKKYPSRKCVYADFEHSFDKKYASELGINVDELLILQPSCIEDGYNLIEELIKTGEVCLVVMDSHTAAMPKKVVQGEVGEVTVGLQARINSQALGKIKPLLKPNKCTMIGISQIRQDVGAMGEVNKATGGLSWKFYADMRVKFARIQTDKEKESNKTQITVIKNKCAPPFGVGIVYIDWGKGYDRMQEIIDAALEFKMINKAGSWITLEDGETKVQGSEQLKEMFRNNEEYYQALTAKVMDKINGVTEVVETIQETVNE